MKKQSKYKDYFSDKTTILTIVALTLALILTILLSFGTNFYFKQADKNFWTDNAISFALCIYCLYFGIPEAKALYMKKDGGRYKVSMTNFEDIRRETSKRDNEFNQWLKKYYKTEKRQYLNQILSLYGIANEQVLDLDINEVDNLLKPYKKCWKDTEFKNRPDTYFKTLSKKQVSIIKDILKGKITVEQFPNDYFKTYKNRAISSAYIEQSKAHKRNNLTYAMLIAFRLSLALIISFIFTSIGFEIVDGGSAEVIMSRVIITLSRLWTMISSFTYGFGLGKIMVMNDASAIEYKTNINKLFVDDKDFVALSEEDLAKQEYEEYQKTINVAEVIPLKKSNFVLLENKGEQNDGK